MIRDAYPKQEGWVIFSETHFNSAKMRIVAVEEVVEDSNEDDPHGMKVLNEY
jgi:hypothetical protein